MRFSVTILLGLVLLISSCNQPKAEIKVTIKINLSDKTFLTSDKPDSACQYVELGTDYFQTFYFINDTEFIQVMNDCCGGMGEDFASEYYCRGKYECFDTLLKLRYAPVVVTHYEQEETKPGDTISTYKERWETKYNESNSYSLKKLNCGNEVYFQEHENGQYLSRIERNMNKEIEDFKKAGIWEKLFTEKQTNLAKNN